MAKIHTKIEHPGSVRGEDLDHELPAAETDGNESAPSAGNGGAPAPAQPDAAQSQTQKLQAERDALLDRLARLQAEFENYRKRNAREQQEFRDYAIANALTTLIPVLDSLDLALKNIGHTQANAEVRAGLELVRKQFADALAKLGVTPVATRGVPFDPQWHQAVEVVESDEAPDHHVLEELQSGYRLKDRLLRPAMVRVASRPKR